MRHQYRPLPSRVRAPGNLLFARALSLPRRVRGHLGFGHSRHHAWGALTGTDHVCTNATRMSRYKQISWLRAEAARSHVGSRAILLARREGGQGTSGCARCPADRKVAWQRAASAKSRPASVRPRPHGIGGKRVRKRSGARRRRFANEVWIASLPNRLLAVDRITPGAGLVDSTDAGGRVYRASCLRTQDATWSMLPICERRCVFPASARSVAGELRRGSP